MGRTGGRDAHERAGRTGRGCDRDRASLWLSGRERRGGGTRKVTGGECDGDESVSRESPEIWGGEEL